MIDLTTANAAILATTLLASSATDIAWHRIPNVLLGPALAAAMLLQLSIDGGSGLATGLGGLAIGAGMLLPLYILGAMCAGDVKLLGVAGAFLGPEGAMVAGLATMMCGGVLGLGVIAWRILLHRLGTLVSMQRTCEPAIASINDSVGSGPRNMRRGSFPYAPAITAGSLIALWHISHQTLSTVS